MNVDCFGKRGELAAQAQVHGDASNDNVDLLDAAHSLSSVTILLSGHFSFTLESRYYTTVGIKTERK